MNPGIRANDLHKEFDGVNAVDGISFEVEEGEIFGFLGPNGAGKTTTVRMLTGVLAPDAGEAWIDENNVKEDPIKAKERIGIAPEVSNAYIDMTGWQNLMFMGELYGVPKEEREKRGESLLQLFGIHDRKDDNVKGYSKGMKKRLILAMALINDPPVLFLDEPTSGLDVQSQRLIRKRIREMNEEGKTIFLTTHNISEANELCERVAVIDHGKIAAIDKPRNLTSNIEGVQSVEVSFDNPPDLSDLKNLDGVNKIEERKDTYRLYTSEPVSIVRELLAFSQTRGIEILSIQTLGPSLEDAFIQLTEG